MSARAAASAWRRVHEQLTTVTAGTSGLDDLQAPLREYLQTEKVITYGVETSGERALGLSFFSSSATIAPSARELFSRYLGVRPDWGNYDPVRPQVEQRNRMQTWTRQQVEESELPVIRDVYPVLELRDRSQTRVLLCEDDTLLAFFGAWQPEPHSREQLRRFRPLLPVLHRRVALERDARDSRPATSGSLLDAALEAIARPVLIVTREGRIREANRLAEGIVRARHDEIQAGVAELLRGRAPGDWSVTRIEQTGGGHDFLVLLPVQPVRADGRLFRALTRRWELTTRQADVLALLCEGRTNQSIAAVLEISPRTVEVHVAALFDKAKVSARSELLAKVLSLA